jgi:hypothetical protein
MVTACTTVPIRKSRELSSRILKQLRNLVLRKHHIVTKDFFSLEEFLNHHQLKNTY